MTVLFCLSCIAPAFALERIAMHVESCFAEMTPQGVYPIRITVRNLGQSLEGAIRVDDSEDFTGGAHSFLYPISLPAGSIKSLIAYPVLETYSSHIVVSFVGPIRAQNVEFPLSRLSGSANIGLIGDTIGGLTALRPEQPKTGETPDATKEAQALNDCYARPEDAPDRAIGYLGLKILVLASGAERLNASQWEAIRQWVMGGGNLIMLGGANAPYLKVPEAQPLIPLVNLATTSIPGLKLGMEKQEDPPHIPTAITTGESKKGAERLRYQDNRTLLATLPYGAGQVMYAAFNPQEEPLRHWKGVGTLWKFLVAWVPSYLPLEGLQELNANNSQYAYSSSSYYVTSGGGTYPAGSRAPFSAGKSGIGADGGSQDPFKIKLPPYQTILWYFAGYCFTVIFVAYVALKALKKLEWNWLVAPLFAVAFSYGLFITLPKIAVMWT